MTLDAATVLLQWATGGLFFLWVTTLRREVGIGYGWLLRGVFGVMALGALAAGRSFGRPVVVRDLSAAGVVLFAGVALAVSVVRRRAGVRGEHVDRSRKMARVAAMTGIERDADDHDRSVREFPPVLDALVPLHGVLLPGHQAPHDGGRRCALL